MKINEFPAALNRRKSIQQTLSTETCLKKCLSTFDLISLGIGCTLGCGIYVVTGEVVRYITGPSVVLSFLIAAFASLLAAFSYAEFGARVPRAGSAYIYIYVTVGEAWAFVIGWNLILEYVIGTASTAKATSLYLDSLLGKKISTSLMAVMPLNVYTLSSYPDFIAFGFIVILTVIVCFGIQESTLLNNIFTFINVSILIFIICFGASQVDPYNWSIPANKPMYPFLDSGVYNLSAPLIEVPNSTTDGVGGFFPHGYLGVMAGASICFYSYIGFDVITIAGEETTNPQKSIPISIMVSLLLCSLAYCLLSATLTMMVPYYSLDIESPLSSAFYLLGWKSIAIVIDIGAIICLISCLLTYVLAMPRVFYAMASDGLLFKFLAKVNQRFQTPINATIISGLFTGLFSMFFDLIDLVNMMSIGTLLAYTLVSTSVLLLRYRPQNQNFDEEKKRIIEKEEDRNKTHEQTKIFSIKQKLNFFINNNNRTQASDKSYFVVVTCFAAIVLLTILTSMILDFWFNSWIQNFNIPVILVVIFLMSIASLIIVIAKQPINKPELSFLVPNVPLLPITSVMINIYLMLNLSARTWVRFVIWMVFGGLIYFGYGIHHSFENETTSIDNEHVKPKKDYNQMKDSKE